MKRVEVASPSYLATVPPTAALDLRLRRGPALLMGAALACLAACALATISAPSVGSNHGRAADRGQQGRLRTILPVALAQSASASIGASEHRFWAVRQSTSLRTSGGGIDSAFSAAGLRLRVAKGTLGLSLDSIGRGRLVEHAKQAAPSSAANVISFGRGSVSEFYRNGPYGLEQGFTLSRRPQAGAGPLVVALRLAGSLIPEQVGSQILFRTPAGETALRYGQLSAVDEAGRHLPAQMEIHNGALQLRIADSRARYPLRIDPFFQQGPKLTGGGEAGKGLFGETVALSADGTTALIGAPNDNGGAGAVRVFKRSGSNWAQQGSALVGGEESGNGHFGKDVALSEDGNTAMVGGPADSSNVGAAWVFTSSGATWEQQGPKLTGAGELGAGRFGFRVALSESGSTALIGGPLDSGSSGAAWAFTRSGSTWEEQAKLIGNEEIGTSEFGLSVSLAANGNTGLIGGGGDSSQAGAAWVFTHTGSEWEQEGPKLTGAGEVGQAHFGFHAVLSEDGNTALIGGGGDNASVGAAWVFTRSGSGWAQQGSKLTSSGEVGAGHLGYSVALSADGSTALVGGPADNSEAGAGWVFTRSGSTWEQQSSKLTGGGEIGRGFFGDSVALSADGTSAMIGGAPDNSEVGAAWAFLSSLAPPPPEVTSVSPSSGTAAGGTKVTIKGSGFVAGATVTIGNPATSVTVVAASEIKATTAATPAGTHEVLVTDANGTSAGGPPYTYVPLPPPNVTSVSPSSGTAAGGTKVTIKGSGFVAGATVTIGNAATSVSVVSATTIKATTAATPAGTHEVLVTDANGTSAGGPPYTYVPPPPPNVTSVSPTSGPAAGGTTVTIKGTNLDPGGTPVVDFGPTAAPNVMSATPTTIVVASPQVPAGATVDVTVTTAGGTSATSANDRFTYIPPPPTVTSIAPSSGTTEGGTAVTIKGSGFLPGATVTIGGEATEVLVLSATEIVATTAPGAAGADEVVVTDASGTSTGGPSFTYVTPPPTVTSIAPSSGTTEGGTAVTIKGSGFLLNTTVTIGGEATEVLVLSATEIVATTAPGAAGADEVVVTDANGTSTGGPSFTYVP